MPSDNVIPIGRSLVFRCLNCQSTEFLILGSDELECVGCGVIIEGVKIIRNDQINE